MKATSRLQAVELGDDDSHLAFFAAFSAAFSCGRRSSASLPLPVSISVNSPMMVKPSACGERGNRLALRFEAEAGAALPLRC